MRAAGGDGIEGRILALLRDEMAMEVPSAETDLVDAGLLDSLSLAELLMRVEVSLGVRVQLAELSLAELRTVAGLARIVCAAAGEGGAS
ncbi:MAG: acyl carrier protein [Polyangiaceae bacterium]